MAFLIKSPIKSEPFYEGPGYNKRVKLQEQAAEWEREMNQLKSREEKAALFDRAAEELIRDADPDEKPLLKALKQYVAETENSITELQRSMADNRKSFEQVLKKQLEEVQELNRVNGEDIARIRQTIQRVEENIEQLNQHFNY